MLTEKNGQSYGSYHRSKKRPGSAEPKRAADAGFLFSLPVVPAWCTLNAESLHAFLVSHAEREDEGA